MLPRLGIKLKEIWKWIRDYRGCFKVSNFGRIKSKIRGGVSKDRILKPYPNKGKYYPQISLRKDGTSKMLYVHILVCDAFHGTKPSNKHEVNHKDTNPLNCHADNLEWATRKENAQHRKETQRKKGKSYNGKPLT